MRRGPLLLKITSPHLSWLRWNSIVTGVSVCGRETERCQVVAGPWGEGATRREQAHLLAVPESWPWPSSTTLLNHHRICLPPGCAHITAAGVWLPKQDDQACCRHGVLYHCAALKTFLKQEEWSQNQLRFCFSDDYDDDKQTTARHTNTNTMTVFIKNTTQYHMQLK